MRWRNYIAKHRSEKALAFLVMCSMILGEFSYGLLFFNPYVADAAQVAVDTTANATGASHLQSGSQTVFTTDQTGYKFYVDSTGICVYSKTTDGGVNWGSAVTVDSQTDCIGVTVWYDGWTPFDTGTSIHIVTMDISADDLFYNRLDTDTDTLLKGSSPVDMSTNSSNSVATFTNGSNYHAVTKGTDGTIYAAVSDASDSYIVECTTGCDQTTGWTETGTNPLDLANDYNILAPLNNGDIVLINRDISLEDIRYKTWNNTSWSASWSFIDQNATDNGTYDVGMAAAVSSSTPTKIYLAYTGDNATLGTDDDVRTAFYNGSSWATTTDVVTNQTNRAITGVAIARDSANGDIYVGYSARTTAATAATGNIYWKKSSNNMTSWGAENGPVNTAANDMYGIDFNILNDERIYGTWFATSVTTIFGDTIADVFPGIYASSTGTQTATINASTSSAYLGGAFSFTDNSGTHNVTGITITESGTIDGSTNLTNLKLFYETDTVAPYDCASVSYNGTESQFGSTDTNGFSGADGVSTFTGSSVAVSSTTALCVYVVADVLDNTPAGSTIEISIANPTTDITSTALKTGPATAATIPGTTTVPNDMPILMHYHWRNDNGSETTATSKTSGVEDTPYSAFQKGTTARVRVEVSNEGSSSTPAMQYRLEYTEATDVCSDSLTGWTDVGSTGGIFDMYNSTNLTEGGNTTNIANATGGVTNENTTFLTPNGGVRDTTSQTGSIVLTSTQYVELEYSIIATSTAPEGNTYCFRVSNQGQSLYGYNQYPRASISADVAVTATGTQITTLTVPTTTAYMRGAYILTENTSSRNVTSITLTASGTINAQTGINNIKLLYDKDITAPYNCASESYAGTELQFGSTDTDGFSSANGTSTFTGSVSISTTSALCLYVVMDITSTAKNGQNFDILIQSPSQDVVVSGGGTVSPSASRDISGVTTLVGPLLTQFHYHWRNDNGSETTATSLSGGVEDTPITYVAQSTPVRLRIEVSNEGSVTSASRAFRLEYGTKITTCSAISAWTDVGATGGAWDMYNSTNITEGGNTTNIANATGGVTNENTTFLTPNSAVKDTSSVVASTTLSSTQYMEMEFSIKQTIDAGYDIPYCFRLTGSGQDLDVYTTYPELRSSPKRDFKVQRNFATIPNGATTVTITAGSNYTAPSASTSAFIRITDTHMTGAGAIAGGNQNALNVTTYITDPSNIMNSITFGRTGTTGDTRIYWEIVEYIGTPGGDNEMIVRSQTYATYGTSNVAATGTAVSGVVDDTDVVVFITGQQNPDTVRTNYNSGQSTSEWNSGIQSPVFTRGDSGNDAVRVSYAVVEFKGQNWIIQRSEHIYTAAGVTETEPINAVNSLYHTFVHAQRRVARNLTSMDNFGHEVWLSSIGYVSYFMESTASTSPNSASVAWIIENTQSTTGEMDVTTSNGNSSGGTAPLTISVEIATGKTLSDLSNAAIFATARVSGTGTNYPSPIAGIWIASSTHYEVWRSNTTGNLSYRIAVVEWPAAGLAIKQNYYRLYVDNNAIKPTDPWPSGATDLGENTVLTGSDEPLGDGERIRLRMSIEAVNATFPIETKAFKLQYGALTTSCSAIAESSWRTLGDSASSTIWRGYNATGTTDGTALSGNPPTGGDLLLSVSDIAGTFEEQNDSAINPYSVPGGDDIEYDWLIEQNGAAPETYYCFRMIDSNGTKLDGYLQYPQIRTASFTPRTQNWRWYSDTTNETPTTALANENTTPVNFANGSSTKLRVTVKEIKNISRDDVRFKLQYSQYANFSDAQFVVATSTCTATSTWCYADGGGSDNVKITTKNLSDALSCASSVGDGCGTHNESPNYLTGFRHKGNAATEYEFTIKSAGPRVNRVYYFRLYDIIQDIPVTTNTGASYPSLATQGASLNFAMGGLTSGTSIEGVTLDINTTPTTLAYGTLAAGSSIEGAHRLAVDTDGTEGYELLMYMQGDLMSSNGSIINPITGTNAAPTSWAIGCSSSATSCFGYHTSDDTLEGGSTRFSAIDTYARVNTTTPEVVAYSTQPAVGDSTDVIFRILRRDLQAAGTYVAKIIYISVPIF